MDHDRMLYYQYLAKLGLFNKTVAQLDRFDFSQQKLIKEEENNTLSDAMTEAHAMIKVAREEFAKEAAAEVARRQEEQAKRQEEIQDAAAKERKRREDENSKQAARIAVRDMAVKACEHPDSVRQSELDALPHPVLPFYFPGDFDLPFCAQRLYSELGFAVQNGKKMDAEWLLDMVQRAQPPQAAYRPPVARAAPAPDFSEKYGDDVRDLAERACDGRETLPIDGLNALYELQRVGKVFNSAQVSQELSGCEKYVYDHLVNDIYVRYFRHTSSTVDELADLVFELSRKSRPPEPAQSLQPPTGSNRAPQPQRHCAAEKSGVCVYWTD